MKKSIKIKRRKTNLRPLVGAGIFTSTLLSVFLAPKPVLAACPDDVSSAGTSITNQASISYSDGTNNYDQDSNTVEVQIAEIAGITVTALGDVDIDTASRNVNDVVGFDFLITNTGNDPTYFSLPDFTVATPPIIGGVLGTDGTITDGGGRAAIGVKVIEIIDNEDGSITDTALDIDATAGGLTSALGVGPDGGLIKPGDQIKVRVFVRITESRATFPVSVQYGNTDPNDNSSASQNQPDAPDGLAGADEVTTSDEAAASGVSADGCASADDQAPANGEREAAAIYEIRVGTDADPLAMAKVLKTRTDHDPNGANDLTDDTLTYRLDLEVDNIQLDSGFAAAPLGGTPITLDGGAATRILVSDVIPNLTEIDVAYINDYINGALPGGITVPAGWTVVYTTALGQAVSTAPPAFGTAGDDWITWNTAAPPAANTVTRIGFVADAATSLAPGFSTVDNPATDGFLFRVITANVVGEQAQIANIAQVFGQTDEDGDGDTDECVDCPIVYDESGDEKPNNFSDDNTPKDDPTTPTEDGTYYDPTNDDGVADPNEDDIDGGNNNTGQDRDPSDGGGEDNVFNLNLNPESTSGILNGPAPNPDAVGPNSNNDDFFEKASAVGAEYDPVDFTNTVRNPGTNADDLDNVVLRPISPTQAQQAAGHDTFGVDADIPVGTTVTIVLDTNGVAPVYPQPAPSYDPTGADGDQVAVYDFDGTNWVFNAGLSQNIVGAYQGVLIDKLIVDGAANTATGTYDVTYQVTIDPPAGPPPEIGESIPVPVVAYPEDTPASDFDGTTVDGDPIDDSVFNIKIDRLFIGGFLNIVKEVRLLDASGNVLQPYSQDPTDADANGNDPDPGTPGLEEGPIWTANPQPGQILEYRVTYKNNGTRDLSGSGNITLVANTVVITEDGRLDIDPALDGDVNGSANNWAINNSVLGTANSTVLTEAGTGIDTSHVPGGANATRGSINYFSGDTGAFGTLNAANDGLSGTTWETDVVVYTNTIGTLTPQQSGTFTFRREIK